MTTDKKLVVLNATIHHLQSEEPEEGSTLHNLILNLKEWEEEIIKEEFPIQDDIWPSRRWDSTRTVSIDLSGQ